MGGGAVAGGWAGAWERGGVGLEVCCDLRERGVGEANGLLIYPRTGGVYVGNGGVWCLKCGIIDGDEQYSRVRRWIDWSGVVHDMLSIADMILPSRLP